MILAADIGGTNTRLRLCEIGSSPREPVRDRRFKSHEHAGLREMVEQFLAGLAVRPKAFAIGVAGPVFDGHARPTNVPWEVDAAELRRALRIDAIEVRNDLVTTGHGIQWLADDQLLTLQAGEPYHLGNGALIAAGTGLGKAILVRQAGGDFLPIPSEGGHCDFAPRDDEQDELVKYLRHRFGGAVAEHLVSGRGIVNIHTFLSTRPNAEEAPEIRKRLAVEDPARVIAEAARQGTSTLCRQAIDLFARAYASEAANLAATALATGGLYIGGGIAPKLLDVLRDASFLRTFTTNPNLHDLLKRIPVRVILEEDASLIGAAGLALALAS